MPTNSFKELEKESSKQFDEREKRVRENVNHSVGFFHFIGDILELFLPKLVSIFVNVTGGKGPVQEREHDPEGGPSSDGNDLRPKYPNTH